VELWLLGVHVPGRAAAAARAAEAEGFDGLAFGDTQHLAADPFAGCCLAAAATERLLLGVRVTNPVTRHPAVTAAAIATVQAVSGGRAVLGLGRGDSALGHLGRGPASVEETEAYLAALQQLLAGERAGEVDPIPWVAQGGLPKVPVDIAASGPRMLDLALRLAEAVTLNVGADPARLAAVAARARPVSVGAYVVVAAHPDASVARDLARGPLGAYAHFSGMPGAFDDALGNADRRVVRAVAADYDLAGHGRRTARHAAYLDDGFVDRFGVVGSPQRCAARLAELAAVGLDRLVLVEGRDPSTPKEEARAHAALVEEVLPAFREQLREGPAGTDRPALAGPSGAAGFADGPSRT
jgi:5,10-methylenetetrahydromethanopterin reductase